jgi:AcrR family transcriptional regulator
VSLVISVNKSGQSLGRKGRRTRANIVSGLKTLLLSTAITNLTVQAVANEAYISAPTFYLYFEDLGEVLLAALEEVAPDMAVIRSRLDADWPADRTYACALAFAQAYFDLWRKHGPVLRARNSLAEQDDARFMKHRHEGPDEFARMLRDKMHEVRRDDTSDVITAAGLSAIIITALERIATLVALEYYQPGVVNWKVCSQALAHIIAEGVRPPKP